jgi:response regulator of citrate/malate metabolism
MGLMGSRLVVVSSDSELLAEINAAVFPFGCAVTTLQKLDDLEAHSIFSTQSNLLIDLDNVPVDNKILRSIRRQHTKLNIMAVSSKRYHPELRDALREDIVACLKKPLDAEELAYWLNSFADMRHADSGVKDNSGS